MELEIKSNALDISSNVWINANAGSGKTKILVDRFIKIILSGFDVSKIVCITYTTSAKDEMQNRIYGMLEKMFSMDDKSLIDFAKNEYFYEDEDVQSIRSRINNVLRDPRCLRVSTVHSICLDILKYDDEYKDYSIIDDKSDISHVIVANVVDKILHKCETDNDLLYAIRLITDEMSMISFDVVIKDIIKNINHLNVTIGDKDDYFNYLMELSKLVNIMQESEIITDFINDIKLFDLSYIAGVMMSGGKRGNESGEILSKWINSRDQAKDIDMIVAAFLNKTNGKPKEFDKKIYSIAGSSIENICIILDAFVTTRKLNKVMHYTKALIDISTHIYEIYQCEKQENFVMDFNDILYKIIDIFKHGISDSEYRIMKSIDHILIDEAQDMSHLTWIFCNNIILNVIDVVNKTFFVVGDHKQSIYSFQGANPQLFKDKMIEYRDIVDIHGGKMHIINLTYSYRSKQEILDFVDQTLSSQIDGYMLHKSNIGIDGIVKRYTSTNDEICNDILKTVKNLSERYKYGDIMILFKDRAFGDSLFTKISRRLSDEGVPVSISRMIKISEHLCIRDFISLFRFCYYSEDDLNLFKLLRSPFFRMDLDEIMNLRAKNFDTSLFDALKDSHPDVHSKLTWYRDISEDGIGILINNISKDVKILDSFYSEFGDDFNNIFDIIVSKSLNFPSARVMYNALLKSNETIPSPSDKNGVIFKTIHSSKGSEAKVVIMIDFDVTKVKNRDNILMNKPKNDAMFFIPKSDDLCGITKRISDDNKKLQIEENIRLKYVAMTRARDELYIFDLNDQ